MLPTSLPFCTTRGEIRSKYIVLSISYRQSYYRYKAVSLLYHSMMEILMERRCWYWNGAPVALSHTCPNNMPVTAHMSLRSRETCSIFYKIFTIKTPLGRVITEPIDHYSRLTVPWVLSTLVQIMTLCLTCTIVDLSSMRSCGTSTLGTCSRYQWLKCVLKFNIQNCSHASQISMS